MRSSPVTVPRAAQPPFGWDALARYVAGESPADEWAAVRAWLGDHAGDAMLVAALDRTLDAAARPDDARAAEDVDVEWALRAVSNRRDVPSGPRAADDAPRLTLVRPDAPRVVRRAPRLVRPTPRRPWRTVASLAAAAVLAVVAAGALLRDPEPGARTTDLAAGTPPAATYATPVGRRDSVRLPDGTRVLLGP